MAKKIKRKGTKRQNPAPPPHDYGDAFRLMRYTCNICGKSVQIWNSRNGVTPFSVYCLSTVGCQGRMLHTTWQHDTIHETQPPDVEWVFYGAPDSPMLKKVK